LAKFPISSFIFKDDQFIYFSFQKRLLDTDKSLSCELRLLKRESTPFWAHLIVSMAPDGDGGSELRMVIKDITDRKNVEMNLRASEEQYRALLDRAPEPIVVHVAGKTVYVNFAAIKMFGATSASDLVGKSTLDLTHPDFRNVVSERMKFNAKSDGGTPMLEQKLLKLDGSVIDVEVSGTQIKFDGEPAVQAKMHDVTERNKVEAKLQLAASVFSHAREGITISGPDGTIVDVNTAFTRITGYSREDALGQNLRLLKSGRQNKEFYIAMWRDLLSSGYWSGEIWNKRKSGEIYPELLTISAVTDAHGEVRQYVGLFSDISVRKQMEEKVNKLAFFDPLTMLPNRRTLSDRLNQAMASSKRSGRYAAIMALDLDNFKSLNDTHGHAAGDLLLQAVAERVLALLRGVDTVARVGGDEFVVMLSELDIDRTESMALARSIAEKIRIALAAPYSLSLTRDGNEGPTVEHRCSASIGVVLFLNHEASQEHILRLADAAMYQAKAAGRNSVRFYGEVGPLE
jgi:diguanylate cyclase (GGDEF)-like protein/PAS domain S-box-containing protein